MGTDSQPRGIQSLLTIILQLLNLITQDLAPGEAQGYQSRGTNWVVLHHPSIPIKSKPPGKGWATPYCFLSPRSLWPACQDSVSTALPFLQEKENRSLGSPSLASQALGPCWELMVIGMSDPLSMARNPKSTQYPNPEPSSAAPPTSLQRRSRKQLNPQKGIEKGDPTFKGVTLKFQIQLDSSLQIVSTYR